MAAVKSPFGFKPSRSLSGNFNPATRRYHVGAGNTAPLFAGDPVVLVSADFVRNDATLVNGVIGVVSQLLDSNQKPLVFSQPTRGPFLPPLTAGFADVYIDPDNIYWVATDATASSALTNFTVHATALSSGNANNRSGRSPYGVEVAGSDVSGAVGHPWRVLGAAPEQRDHLTNADWTEGVEVVLDNTHLVNAL